MTAKHTRRQADAAQAEVHLAYTPELIVTRQDEPSRGPDVYYAVRNDGRKDLDSVIAHRPITSDHVRYPIARAGTDWADEVQLGPLPMGATATLTLCVGSTGRPPEFRVRLVCRTGDDVWMLSRLLEHRPTPQVF